jgi:hypothetical protein
MRLRTLMVLAGTTIACGGEGYSRNDLQLLTAYTAKETCSCLFVMEQTEEYCRAWTKASPAVATWSADLEARTVDSAAGLFWGARAHYVDEKFGCVLDE